MCYLAVYLNFDSFNRTCKTATYRCQNIIPLGEMIYSNAGIVDIKTFDCIQIVLLNVCRMNYYNVYNELLTRYW